ncbi:MAG: linear amide C-N hydrolase [Deltaproteobacteria bacterium]|nr:linear amide C-N hydrolase [Deltaproteobacteria bacterium]
MRPSPFISLATAFVTLLLHASLTPSPVDACTAFGLVRGRHIVVGKSYDWHNEDGLLVVNKRGVVKRALLLRAKNARPAHWTSRFGSVTFNQYGRELPLGGINERGLVVEILWLASARYGNLNAHQQTVNELSFIQYLLDTAATTSDAIVAASQLQIARAYARVHYLVCDRGGRCATLEHLGGRLEVHHGPALNWPLLTNTTYRVAQRHLATHRGFGGKKTIPKNSTSLSRFVRAASLLRTAAKVHGIKALVARAFSILKSVRVRRFSRWNIVYDPTHLRIHLRLVDHPALPTLTVDVAKQDFRCDQPSTLLDITGALTNKRGIWLPYTRSLNEKLIKASLRKLGNPLPAVTIKKLARYPERLRCSP